MGAPVGAVVLLVAGAARPRGLMGRVMVRPSTAPSYEASCPGSYTPPKMDSHWGMHPNLRPERCRFTHPLSSQWRKHSSQWDPRIKAARRPIKTLAYVKSPAPIGSVMGDRGFPDRGFHAHAPPPPVCRQPPPPAPLLRMRCRKRRRNAQRRVMYVTLGLEKRGASGEYPPSSAKPCVLHCHVLHLGLHLLDVGHGLLLLHPPSPPAASFFFLFSLLLLLPPLLLLLLLLLPPLLPPPPTSQMTPRLRSRRRVGRRGERRGVGRRSGA